MVGVSWPTHQCVQLGEISTEGEGNWAIFSVLVIFLQAKARRKKYLQITRKTVAAVILAVDSLVIGTRTNKVIQTSSLGK